MKRPSTNYVKSDDVHIAYQIVGEGPFDLLIVPGFVSNIEAGWQNSGSAAFFRRLSSFCRLILFDKRGTGMSDRGSQDFTLEQRMHDVQAVLEAVKSDRAALLGISEGGPMSLLYAATYPERTSALILYGSYAKRSQGPDFPLGWGDERWKRLLDNIESNWGTPAGVSLEQWAPSVAQDPDVAERMAAYFRAAASPGAAAAIMRMNRDIDVRPILPLIRTPTLILHRSGDRIIDIGHAHYMVGQIPGSTLRELPGDDHMWWINGGAIVDQIEQFLTGKRLALNSERVLATVLFADLVGSTERAALLGDQRWRELLESFYAKTGEVLEEYRGRQISTAGDGFLATFDGPARAIRCAGAIRDAVHALGLEARCGLHTGECEMVGEDLAGIAVHIGARVASLAAPGEVLVSQTVRDLVAGSGLALEERGTHALKGVPGEWQLFRAELP